MDHSTSIENYVQAHLEEEDSFFILEKAFWTEWTNNVGFFTDSATFTIKKDQKKQIDN